MGYHHVSTKSNTTQILYLVSSSKVNSDTVSLYTELQLIAHSYVAKA